jgi:RNA polymerase sigma factor (sigma-70 family)
MPDPDPGPQAGQFPSTCWSVVLAARDPAEPRARQALASLCSAYWYPLYAFIRRRGSPPELAEDLTQEFFAGLLRRGSLDRVAPERGRFRAFLLAACKNFLANRRDHDRARKRGGGVGLFPIDGRDAEGRYGREPSHEMTAERLYERRWALTLLDRVLARLAAEMDRAGKGALFARLEPTLLGGRGAAPYAVVAGELGLTEGAVKVAAHRLRRRYRELLRAEIGRTVADPAGVDQEIGELFAALACRERGDLM